MILDRLKINGGATIFFILRGRGGGARLETIDSNKMKMNREKERCFKKKLCPTFNTTGASSTRDKA